MSDEGRTSAASVKTQTGHLTTNRTHLRRDEGDIKRAGSQEEEILSRLRLAGPLGCLNSELWDICHAVNSRIAAIRKRLRRCGFDIEALPEGRGIWRYRIIKLAPAATDPRPAEKLPSHKPTTLPLFGGSPE